MFFDKHAEKWDSKRRIERAKIISEEILKNIEYNLFIMTSKK
ncbi:MAG: hypothetical protein ACQESN_11855 [Thermotogota bacterium]